MKALQQTAQMRGALLAAIITHSDCTTTAARKRSCSRQNLTGSAAYPIIIHCTLVILRDWSLPRRRTKAALLLSSASS